ncbi:MAG: sortase [Varibaculum cambriense]|uniref:sortase n=1 Tax=Varibaculum cambriense TaxID=184870 RepID=UPI0028FEC5C3|nr:sortase [Varibaculum cambriense]MDU1051574.1 sortase [Varibaculum cambriense]
MAGCGIAAAGKTRRARWVRWIQVICIALSLLLVALLGYSWWQGRTGDSEIDGLLTETQEVIPSSRQVGVIATQTPENAKESGASSGKAAGKGQGGTADTSAPDSASPYLETVNLSGYEVTGILQIADLNQSWPIIASGDAAKTAKIPSIYGGNPASGDLVIADGADNQQFSGLKDLPDGSKVIFTDISGREYRYQLATVETVSSGKLSAISRHRERWDAAIITPNFSGRSQIVTRLVKADSK